MANINWLNDVSGDFNTGTNWSGGMVPTVADNVTLGALGGTPYTVTDSSTGLQQMQALQVAANVTLDIAGTNFQALAGGSNAGTITTTSGGLFLLDDAFANSGTIAIDGAHFAVQGLAITLTGAGQIQLNDPHDGLNTYGGGSLVNTNNTIIGSGGISAPITNGRAGVIDANGAGNGIAFLAGNMFISGSSVANAGLIEATSTIAGTFLDIRRGSVVDQSGGGTILAANGAVVYLEQVNILGGTLSSVGTGVFDVGFSNTVLDGSASPLAIKATVNLTGGYTTGQYEATLKGAIVNSGMINVAGARQTGDQTNLIIDPAGVTLTGAGSINLVPGVPSQHGVGTSAIVGASGGGSVLTNVDNTITGMGDIGQYALTLINQTAGVIDANAAGSLTLDASSTTTNSGLIEATGAGGLIAAGAITNSGTMLANGGALSITGALSNLSGTTLSGGVFEADANSTLGFNATTHIVTDKATLILNGANSVIQASAPLESTLTTINKAGVLEILGGRNWTSSVSLSNAGTLDLGGGTFTTATLANSGKISGFGTLAATVTNTGTISVQFHSALSLVGGTLTNLSGSTLSGGVFAVAGKGVLQLANNVSIATLDATVDLTGAGATIQSLDTSTSSQVTLAASLAAIGSGGVLRITGGDSFAAANTLTNAGAIDLSAGTLTLAGLVNTGSLAGAGAVIGAGPLINQVGGVIDGAGPGVLTLSSPGAVITNVGALEATAGGALVIQGATIASAGGTVVAGAGSTVTFQASMVTGGAFDAASTGMITIGDGSTATIDSVTSDAGTILLNSTGSTTSLIFETSASLSGGGVLALGANANNFVKGTKASIVLTNVDDTIEGSGKLGDNKMTLINQAGGVIDANASVALTIGTGLNTIANAGLIEATNEGKATVTSAVANTGVLEANDGTLTLAAAVTGAGSAVIADGVLMFASKVASIGQNVAFTGTTGKLVLADSAGYTGQVSGFSHKGKTSLDLRDIAFTGPGQASFTGTATSGVLTVTDGAHTAHITLIGNYTNAAFVTSSDGAGGVLVVDPSAPPPSPHTLIAAMASFGAPSAAAIRIDGEANPRSAMMLAAGRCALA